MSAMPKDPGLAKKHCKNLEDDSEEEEDANVRSTFFVFSCSLTVPLTFQTGRPAMPAFRIPKKKGTAAEEDKSKEAKAAEKKSSKSRKSKSKRSSRERSR